jgi:hypothetical protein
LNIQEVTNTTLTLGTACCCSCCPALLKPESDDQHAYCCCSCCPQSPSCTANHRRPARLEPPTRLLLLLLPPRSLSCTGNHRRPALLKPESSTCLLLLLRLPPLPVTGDAGRCRLQGTTGPADVWHCLLLFFLLPPADHSPHRKSPAPGAAARPLACTAAPRPPFPRPASPAEAAWAHPGGGGAGGGWVCAGAQRAAAVGWWRGEEGGPAPGALGCGVSSCAAFECVKGVLVC